MSSVHKRVKPDVVDDGDDDDAGCSWCQEQPLAQNEEVAGLPPSPPSALLPPVHRVFQ